MVTFVIARGSIDPRPRFSLKQDGLPLDLTAALGVRLVLATSWEAASAALDVACEILDAAEGQVTPDWDSSDTDLPARAYVGHLYIDWGSGNETLFPPAGLSCLVKPATMA